MSEKMRLRQSVIGVHHHDCWGSLSTESFPELSMEETGPILVEKTPKGIMLTATWNVSFPKKEVLKEFLKSLNKFDMIKKKKVIIADENKALLKTVWKNKNSSYDVVFQNDCLYSSPVTQKNGYEIYTTLSENPKEVTRLMNELEQIGEVKVFKIGKLEKENPFVLTDKQIQALQAALNYDYYSWPRKITLEELAATVRTSRRAYQENLRKAEMKIFPNMIKSVLDKNRLYA